MVLSTDIAEFKHGNQHGRHTHFQLDEAVERDFGNKTEVRNYFYDNNEKIAESGNCLIEAETDDQSLISSIAYFNIDGTPNTKSSEVSKVNTAGEKAVRRTQTDSVQVDPISRI